MRDTFVTLGTLNVIYLVVVVVLKLTGAIAWPWWLVLATLWGPLLAAALCLAVVVVYAMLTVLWAAIFWRDR